MSSAGNLKEQLEQYVKRVKDFHESCRDNEAKTKQSLIAPLFTILGYDVTDPRVCDPEYKAKFDKKVRSKQPVDWAFSISGSLVFLVEAKAVGKKIDRYDEQLGDYFAKEQGAVKLGVLTTGVHWSFFTDLDKENLMDSEPFLKWDVLKGPIPFEFLTGILQRDKFDPTNIKPFAKSRHRHNLLVDELTRLFEPSPEFVRLAIQNFEDRHLVAAVIEEWKPILAGAIHEWAEQQRLTTALVGQQISVGPSNLVGKPGGIHEVQTVEPSSKKEIVYRVWVEDKSMSPERCLEVVGNRVHWTNTLGRIRWLFSQWKLGRHLPACARTEKPPGEEWYTEFWQPMRSEPNGLFAGKPAGGAWVSKRFRGICLSLVVHNHASCIDLGFEKEDRAERRDKAVKLLPALKDAYKFHDTPKAALVRFPVLDKGIVDRERWPEIREKLKLLGENIYNALSESDV